MANVVTCPVCKKDFPRRPSESGPGACCSIKCSSEHRTRRVELVCANTACGARFVRAPYRIHRDPKDACCSRKCATAHMRDRGMHRLPFRRVDVTPAVAEAPPEPIPHCVDYEDVPLGA